MTPVLLPVLDRTLHQQLPHPLSRLYRKTCNSETAKDLHDNACHFGLCLLKTLAALAMALWRDQRLGLAKEDEELLAKLRRPSDGLWLQFLTRALARLRQQSLPVGSLGVRLAECVYDKREVDRSGLAASLGHLLSFLEDKPVVRSQASVYEFLDTLVRYRNATIGHGAVQTEEINQANGAAVLKGAEAMARAAPLWDDWELKYAGQVNLDATVVVCRYINLMGPDWLRKPPVSYPRGYPAPLPWHVVLMPKSPGARHLDLHPLLLFHKDSVAFFNGFKGRAPAYLDYSSADLFRMENLAEDYADWETSLVRSRTGHAGLRRFTGPKSKRRQAVSNFCLPTTVSGRSAF